MKIQLLIILLCTIAVTRQASKRQSAQIAKFNNLLKKTRSTLPKRATVVKPARGARPGVGGPQFNSFPVLHQTVRRVLQLYGLNFLIRQLRNSQVVLYPGNTHVCYLIIEYIWVFQCHPFKGCHWQWFLLRRCVCY